LKGKGKEMVLSINRFKCIPHVPRAGSLLGLLFLSGFSIKEFLFGKIELLFFK